MASLEQQDGIFTLYLPVAFTPDDIIVVSGLLDEVESYSGASALIVTNKHPKIFCAGMNMKFLLQNGIRAGIKIGEELMKIGARLASFPVPTIAAINGHVIAVGLIFAMSLDYRIMAQDQGTVAMNEIKIGIVLTRGAMMIFNSKLAPAVVRDLCLRSQPFTPQEALEARIVDSLVPSSELMAKARALAKEVMSLGEKKEVYKQLKTSIYMNEIEELKKGYYHPEFIQAMKENEPKL
jgi:Delta3-Delta2-enoyl-CoA isomerase